jgi:nucleoid DNA-binding protein
MLCCVSRALAVLALATPAACSKDPPTNSESYTTDRATPMPTSPNQIERLINYIEAMRPEEVVYLDDLGWFPLQYYKAYEGRNPRTGERIFVPHKALVLFQADPNLIAALNGRPRQDLGDPAVGAPGVVIHRLDWARSLARHAVDSLAANGVTEIAGFGTLRIEQREVEYDLGRPTVTEHRVFWEMSEQLRTRLASAVARWESAQ